MNASNKHSGNKVSSHWGIIEPVKKTIYKAMTLAAIGGVSSLIAFYLLALIIRDYSLDSGVNWVLFAGVAIMTIVSYMTRGASFKISHIGAFALEPILRNNITTHLAKVSLGTLSEQGTSALVKVIQDDIKDLHVFVADSTPLYARCYVVPLVCMAMIFFIDWRLALVAVGVLVLGMTIMSIVMVRSKNGAVEEYNQAREDVNSSIIEFIQAMPVVRTFDNGQASFGRYEKALDGFLDVLKRWYKENGTVSSLSMAILNPMPTIMMLLWVGTYWIYGDSLDFSTWLAILLLGTGMAEALMPYMSLYHHIEKSKISITRINEVMALPILAEHTPKQLPTDASVTFEHVDFCYSTRDSNALTDISFSVPAGSFTALVGGSGAGKSTVAMLIPRFWDVNSGSVRIGGADVKHIPNDVLMKQVAFVFQDNFLFSGSISENIALGMPNATHEQIIESAKAAQAHTFIMELPNGYDTKAGERGGNLSGGQRQRITIARAILQNRPILVLDEATAFADAENEALLMKALHKLMQGKTVLMIAHRLKTIANADQILVFKDGKLAEAGVQQQLLTNDGEYAKLWQAYQTAQNWTINN